MSTPNTKQTGQKGSRLIVVAENLQFLSDRTGSAQGHQTRHDPDLEREREDIPF